MDRKAVSQLTTHDAPAVAEEARVAIKPPNDICYENAAQVFEEIRSALSRQPASISVDLSEVRTVDSSGLRTLIQARRACESADVVFDIPAVSDCAARIISMSGFAEMFGLHALPVRAGPVRQQTVTPVFAGWQTFEHVVDSDPSLISGLREAVAEIADDAGADNRTLCDLRIAVGEALTNAYKHGSPRKGEDRITLRCMSCPQAVVVEVIDEGEPFDPDGTCEPNPKLMRDHGMGIYLMREAMDVVEFACGCPGNRVRMIKWLKDRDVEC